MPVSQIRKLRTPPLIQTQDFIVGIFQSVFLAAPRSFVTSFLLLICVLWTCCSQPGYCGTPGRFPKLLAINKEQGIKICKSFALLKKHL